METLIKLMRVAVRDYRKAKKAYDDDYDKRREIEKADGYPSSAVWKREEKLRNALGRCELKILSIAKDIADFKE